MESYVAGRVLAVFAPLVMVLALLVPATASASLGEPTIASDHPDYMPGDTVRLNGSSWDLTGDQVHIVVNDDSGQTWSHVADVTPALDGTIADEFTLPDRFVASYSVTATQQTLLGPLTATTSFTDAAANLDQCQNGGVGKALEPCSEVGGFANWVNGNVNGSKAHWREGEFLPYRDAINVDAAGTHVFRIHYDTIHSGTHAIDYLGSFDATETTSATANAFHANNNNPCGDLLPAASCTPSSPADSYPIPAATLANCGGSSGTFSGSQVAGSFKIFGGNGPDITNVAPVTENVVSGTGQCATTMDITFTTSSSGRVVLAWGGHIASEANWGAGQSASFISGSPYHMAQDSLTSNGVVQSGVGSQDMPLATSAVVFTPSMVTDIKKADGTSVTNGSVPVGTIVHDTATLTGASSNAGGTVTYSRFNNASCTGTPTATQTVTVTNGTVPDSATFTPSTAGGYSYSATYSGNNGPPENLGATAACEPLTVVSVTPTVTTSIHDPSHNIVTSVALGTTVHDSVSVTGSSGTASGSITFDFFNNDTCTGTAAATSGSFSLTSGAVDATTFTQGPLVAGSYSFKAHYAGGGNYSAADGGCEPLTVTKANSSTSTDIHDAAHNIVTSVALGSTVHDRAAVSSSNTSFAPTGTVSFTFYAKADCTGDATAAGSVSVDGSGVAHPSDSEGPLAAGSYSFKAIYTGDDNFLGSTADCEPLTVNQASSSTVTTIHNAAHDAVTSVALGSTVHDRAAVSSSNTSFAPTGSVTFRFYSNGTCTGDGTAAGSVSVDAGGVAHPSDSEGPLAAGSYSFKAHYAGDGNFTASDADCEPLTVNQASSSTATTIHNAAHNAVTSVPLGSTVHDQANVSSSNTIVAPTGSVSFTFYSNGTCTGDGTAAGTVTIDGDGVAHPSDSRGPLIAGSYSFKAHYGGDANFTASNADCEPLTVNQATSSTVTTIHNAAHDAVTSVDLGSTVHDRADVSSSNSSFAPTGSVSFKFYSGDTCGGTATAAGTATVDSAGIAHPSTSQGPLGAGSYSFKATYSGDGNFAGSTADCEPLTVTKGTSGTATTIHDASHTAVTSVALGTTVHDRADVSGSNAGFAPTGSVSFRFYSNGTCDGAGTAAGSASVDGSGIAHPSDGRGPLGAGSYSFKASYGGDDNYAGSDAACEPLSVEKGTPSITTTLKNAANDATIALNSTQPLGTSAYDTASVTNGGFPLTGTVTFEYYKNNDCSGTAEAADTGKALGAKSFTKGPLGTGDYAFRAKYVAGIDPNHNDSAWSDCEPFKVGKGTPSSSTTLKNAANDATIALNSTQPLGTSAYDTASVTNGGFPLTGTVTFEYYKNNDCSGTAEATDTGKALGASSFTKGPLAAGNYAFRAKYVAGIDPNHNDSAWSDCEPFKVDKATPTISTTVKDKDGNTVDNTHPAAATTTVHDTATLGGNVTGFSFNGTATVTYRFYTNNGCTGTASTSEDVTVTSAGAVPDSAAKTLAPGSYSYKATYNGNANYNAKTGDCEPFMVVQKSLVTDSMLCTFDLDTTSAAPGNTFRLLYTPDSSPSSYKLNASNPGQFYYNVFDNAPTGTVKFTVPYPFVTQGTNAMHAYDGVTIKQVNGQTCLVPSGEIAHDSTQITLADYKDTNLDGKVGFGDTATASISFASSVGFAYVNIHLDYGLKTTTGWSKGGTNGNDANSTLVPPLPTIKDYQSYTFSETDGQPDSQTASSRNEFKKNPGVAGMVQQTGTMMPIANAQVMISGDGKSATVTTDQDGWYMWSYKYTGKATSFTVKLLPSGPTQTVTVKSNGFVLANPFLVGP